MYDAQLELLEADENEGDLEWSLKKFHRLSVNFTVFTKHLGIEIRKCL